MPKKKKVDYDIITAEQQYKFDKAARRQIDIERGNLHIKGGPHGGTKRDIMDDLSNTLSPEEIQELLQEESINDPDNV